MGKKSKKKAYRAPNVVTTTPTLDAQQKIGVEYMTLSELKRWPRNPKLHDHDALGGSINRFGFVQPITVDERTGQIVAGHGRLETLQKMKAEGKPPPKRIVVDTAGEWTVPVIRGVSFASDTEAEAFLVSDNKQAELGGWDEKMLADMLNDIATKTVLDGVGYKQEDVDRLLKMNDPAFAVGVQPAEALQTFVTGEIKQVVLYFDGKQYDELIPRLQKVMEQEKLTSNTEVFLKLLENYESAHSVQA